MFRNALAAQDSVTEECADGFDASLPDQDAMTNCGDLAIPRACIGIARGSAAHVIGRGRASRHPESTCLHENDGAFGKIGLAAVR
jgi:hypothetical protein